MDSIPTIYSKQTQSKLTAKVRSMLELIDSNGIVQKRTDRAPLCHIGPDLHAEIKSLGISAPRAALENLRFSGHTEEIAYRIYPNNRIVLNSEDPELTKKAHAKGMEVIVCKDTSPSSSPLKLKNSTIEGILKANKQEISDSNVADLHAASLLSLMLRPAELIKKDGSKQSLIISHEINNPGYIVKKENVDLIMTELIKQSEAGNLANMFEPDHPFIQELAQKQNKVKLDVQKISREDLVDLTDAVNYANENDTSISKESFFKKVLPVFTPPWLEAVLVKMFQVDGITNTTANIKSIFAEGLSQLTDALKDIVTWVVRPHRWMSFIQSLFSSKIHIMRPAPGI